MLKIKQAVIVEGKYDKIKLTNILDTLIIETNGFGIYKDKERQKFIKKLANERGIVILTDSDHSGFQIRHFLSSMIPKEQITNVYIPDVFGKEKRKDAPSKEGKLGVEGMTSKIILEAFEKANINCAQSENRQMVTKLDLFDDGLSGRPNSKEKKKKLLKALNLPEFLSTNSFLSVINSSMTYEEYKDAISNL